MRGKGGHEDDELLTVSRERPEGFGSGKYGIFLRWKIRPVKAVRKRSLERT